jgi:glycosyltransferase involved in cell wall biosynthesis
MSAPASIEDRASEGIWIVIPAYNEDFTVHHVVAELRRRYQNIVVVDDCSTDSTSARAKAAGACIIRHPINLGQGAALQTGLTFALLQGARYVVTFDADHQHRSEDVPLLLGALANSGADFALGSRFLGETRNISFSRKLVLKAAVLFSRLTTGLNLSDAHNGLRAMTRRGASTLCLRQNRMAHASEILQQIARSGLKYIEVPVTIEYTSYSKAKGQRLSNSLNIMLELLTGALQR